MRLKKTIKDEMNLGGLATENPPSQEFPNHKRDKNYGSQPGRDSNSYRYKITVYQPSLL